MGDHCVRMLSLSGRGFWIELLNYMMVNGSTGKLSASVPQMARLAGCQEHEAHSCLNELKTSGAADVFDQDGLVTVINRRMQREHERKRAQVERTSKSRNKEQLSLIQVNEDEINKAFEQFWAIYPRKTAKTVAEKAFRKAFTFGVWPGHNKVADAIRRQSVALRWTKDREEYIPHPATWLNQHRWNDVCDGSVLSKPSISYVRPGTGNL